MKRLPVVLAAAVAVLTASAIVTDTQLFEEDIADYFRESIPDEDSSGLADHGTAPGIAAPYPCSGFGSKYLSLDTGDATLWRTNVIEGDVYFDMAMKFTPTAAGDEPEPTGKIVVYMDSDTNVVVISGTSASDQTPTTNVVPVVGLAANAWVRLTISAVQSNNSLLFDVLINGASLNSGAGYYSLEADTTVREIGFRGSGAIDDFVARTTDPFYSGAYAARIDEIGDRSDCEKYLTYSDAFADALIGTPATITLSDQAGTTLNGTAENPYQIPNLACLQAFQKAMLDNPAVRSLCYVQTADIDLSGVDEFAGIGMTDTSGPTNGVPFAGTYDGQGHKIANVKLSWRKYAGIFNQVNGATIKNLIGENVGFAVTGSGEHGCAMVGNGIATLENLVSRYTVGFSVTNTHNSGGIMVRAEGDSAFINCTNEADLVCCRDKMGGICCFVAPAKDHTVTFTGCVNTGSYTLVTPPAESTYKPGSNGFAGILGYAQGAGDISMQNCENTGAFVNNLDTTQYNNVVRNAELLGFNHCSGTVNDLGGNKFNAANKAVHSKDTGTIGFKYATVDNNVATTTTTLAKDTTYLLLWDVAASETPVFTLQAAGDYIAFDTKDFTFAGTVAVSDPNLIDVSSETVGTVTTYTAGGGVAVASITKGGDSTSYNTVAKALEAAESGDTVVLLAANSDPLPIPEGVTVDCSTFANTGTIGGSGTIKVNAAPASAPVFANDWTGTFQIFWQLAGATDITIYGNANSTIEIAVATSTATDGADRFYFATAGAASTITSTLKLSATVTQNDGWISQTTRIAKLTGTGDFIIHSYYTAEPLPFEIGNVEGYSGTLGGLRDGFAIANISQSGATFGDCLVKYGGAKGLDVSATTLNGNPANLVLDTLDGQRGVYLAAASVTINGVAVGYASIDAALAAADAAYADSVTVYDTAGATNDKPNWSYENGVYTSTREIATVDGTPYTSLANAIAAAVSGGKSDVVLIAATSEVVTIPAGVTVSVTDDIVFSGSLSGAGAIRYTKAPVSFVKADLLAGDWTGTYVADYAINGDWNVNAYGTASSVVEVADTWTGWYNDGQWVTTLKVSGQVEIRDGTTLSRITISKVTGDGVFVFNCNKNYTIDQLENWDGIMTNFYNSCFVTNIVSGTGTVVFTSQNPADGNSIAVGQGFSGRLEYLQDRWDGSPYDIQVADGSSCTVALNFNKSSWTGVLAAYGANSSTIEIGGNIVGYLSDGNGNGTGRIDSKVVVAGSMSINNCWPITAAITSESWTSARCVQFADLTVDGAVALAYGNDGGWSGVGYGLYSIARLNGDGTGSITVGNDFALKIDSVDFAELPAGTDALVTMTLAGEDTDEYHKQGRLYGPNGVANENIPVTTNGVATGQFLVYDSEKGGLVLYAESPSVVVPVVSPGTNTVYDCGSAANAAIVADAMNDDKATYIQAPTAAGLTGEGAAAYANLFDARADGSNVILELNDAGTNALETAATNVAAQIVTPANLALILSDTLSINIVGAQPGFYYTVVYSDNLATLDTAGAEGGSSLAGASGEMTLAMPARESNATSGFYRVKVYVKEPPAPAGN